MLAAEPGGWAISLFVKNLWEFSIVGVVCTAFLKLEHEVVSVHISD